MRTAVVFSLGTSVLLGTGALLVARTWVPPAKIGPTSASAAATSTVPVVVAGAALAYGETVSPGKLQVEQFPAGLAPQGAYSSVAQLTSGAAGAPIALAAIAPREPILPGKVSGPGARDTVSIQIAPGMRAYAIRISDVAGVGGQALPGDHVDVVLTREPPLRPGQQPGRQMISDVVVQDVRLLGVNLNIDPASTSKAAAPDPKTATLEVSLQDAQKLAVAAGVGNLSLALRRAGATDVDPTRQVQTADLSTAGARSEARPVQIRHAIRRAPAGAPHYSVMVVQGDHDADVAVPTETHGGV